MYGVVYSVTNNLDGKQYVGQTTRTLEERCSEHTESDSLLGRAIQRDGAENFSCKVLVECETQTELDKQERLYIKKLDCKHPKGYNSTDGGRFNGSKTNEKKQLDPHKEFFFEDDRREDYVLQNVEGYVSKRTGKTGKHERQQFEQDRARQV